MIRTVVESGYDGPIGILDHREQLDARESLLENRDGLEWVRKEIEKPGSGGPKPVAPADPKSDSVDGHVYPGAEAYRHPPITVEVRATIQRRDQYNILVASDTKQSADHWELFSMNGSGVLTAYLPGMQPDHVHSEADDLRREDSYVGDDLRTRSRATVRGRHTGRRSGHHASRRSGRGSWSHCNWTTR